MWPWKDVNEAHVFVVFVSFYDNWQCTLDQMKIWIQTDINHTWQIAEFELSSVLLIDILYRYKLNHDLTLKKYALIKFLLRTAET